MLTGRESVMRLVGKKRRTLSSNTTALLLSHRYKSCSSLLLKEEESNVKSSFLLGKEDSSNLEARKGNEQQQQRQSCDLDLVTCPVCGSIIRGADYTVNSRLDGCLTRGKKRKLTQSTLLQFNFSSGSKDNMCLSESDNVEDDARQRGPNDINEPNTDCVLAKSVCAENKERNDCTSNSIYFLKTNLETCAVGCSDENVNREDATNCEVVDALTSLSSLNAKMPTLDVYHTGIGIATTTLETYIVGRKFCDEVVITQGASIFLSREPENVKDTNAIKVLCTDSGSGQMLGFLPRELAKYLSPLIDKYRLDFKGSVRSTPKHPHDVIPIQLVCHEMTPCCEMDVNNHQVFQSLWRNAVRVVEYENAFPVGMTKYQRNFQILMLEVLKQDGHLFTDDEKLFLGSFDSLSDDSQRLFVRLYTRKGPWFRMSDISYPEISDSQQAVEQLCVTGFLHSFGSTKKSSKTEILEVLDVLTVSELREISTLVLSKFFFPLGFDIVERKKSDTTILTCFRLLPSLILRCMNLSPAASQKGIHCAKKEELVGWLFAAYEEGICPALPNLVLKRTGTCIQISSSADFLMWRIQRLFFLNGEQDLSSFLLVDLGLVKYPVYVCNISQHVFADRSDLLAYEEAIEVAQVMDESLDDNNMEMVIRCIEISDGCMSNPENANHLSSPEFVASFLPRFSASWIFSKVVTLGISFFERERRYAEAVRLLQRLLDTFTCDSRRGYWTLRLSVDLEHMGFLNKSLSLAEEGVLDPWVRAGSNMALQRRVLRLGKPPRRWKTPSFAASVNRKIKEVHVRGRPLNCEQGLKNRFYGDDEGQCGVEQLALQYYAGEGGGWQGVHAESGIWTTIFGLLMWDIIFADIPDVFRTRFQTAPLDLYTDSFYITRKSLIEAHLLKIHAGMAEEIIIASWESHMGTACLGVNWDRHSLPDLRAAVACVRGPCLASLCRHLAQDYRSWSSGLPDLLLWRFYGEYGGEAKLVEVKGPRDRLSEQQRAWLLLLMDCGFNIEVCKVSPMPSVS